MLVFPGGSVVKKSTCQPGDIGFTPGSERSSGDGNGNPLQYSFLGNSMDKEPGRLQSMGSQKGRTWLSNWATAAVRTLWDLDCPN